MSDAAESVARLRREYAREGLAMRVWADDAGGVHVCREGPSAAELYCARCGTELVSVRGQCTMSPGEGPPMRLHTCVECGPAVDRLWAET